MSKYLIDQAHEREQRRNRLLGLRALPETPQAPTTSRPVETSAGLDNLVQQLKANMAPKGVAQTAGPDLKVAPGGVSRASGDGGGAYNSGDGGAGGLGGLLDNLRNLGGKKGADVRDRSATAVAARNQYRRDTTPGPYAKGEAATQYAQGLIPGLKPGIDASKAMPGTPAAQAYMEQQRGGPGVTAVDKNNLPAGYQEDLRFLEDRGGHHTKVIDGKKTDVPLTEKGGYKDLDPELAARLHKAGEDYEAATGKKAKYGEFSRGEDVQKIYWEDSAHGTKYAAASPGNSRHQGGAAGDLPAGEFRDWLKSGNQDKYGLHFPVKGDEPHVQANPAYKGEAFAKPSTTAELPAWDKGLPQTDAKTNWPAPSATTPADQIKATPVATGPAQPGGEQALAAQRADYKAQADANPKMRETMAAIMLSESSTPEGQQGTAEAMMNRVKAGNRPFSEAMDPAYHADYMVKNPQKFEAAVAKIRNDPQLRDQLYSLQDKAFNGSNVSKLATDYASAGVADNSAKTSTETYASPDGQRFFRKDTDPVNDGPGTVAANKKWYAETSAALGRPNEPPGPGAGPLASPADKGSPVATLRDAVAPGTAGTVDVGGGQISPVDSATPSAAAFEKGGAPAVPYHGVGGMFGPEYEASTTSATLSGPDTQALNAIKKPTASAQAVAAPPAAAAPPATPGAVAAPLSQPPGTAAAPPPPAPVRTAAPPPAPPRAATPPLTPAQVAKPLSGYDKARAMVDQPLRQILSPEELKQVPESYQGQTPRQIYNTPLVGGIAMTKMEPLFKQKGFTRDDAMKALSTPPDQPGKRSDAGTSSGLLDKAQGLAAAEPATPGPQYAQADTGVRSDASPGPAPGSGARAPWASDARLAQMAYQPTDEPWARVDAQRQSSPEMTAYVQKQMADERAGRDAAWADMRRAPIEDRRGESDLHGKISGAAAEVMDKSGIGDLVDIATGKIPDYIKARFTDPAQTPLGVQAGLNDLKNRQGPQAPQPQAAAPQITPEMAKAIENAVKIDSGPPVVAQPDAQPVLTSSQPGGAGAGLSLAPSGLQNLPAGLAAPGAGPMQSAFMPGSQGGGIAMLGVQPQTGVFSTPLLDSAVQQPAGGFAAGSLSPIAPQFMGWGGGFGGTSGGSGFGGMYGDSMLGSEVGMGNTMGSMFGSG